MEWVCGGLVIALLGSWIINRILVYRRIFANQHFIEVTQSLRKIREAAINDVIDSRDNTPLSPNDPRVVVTSSRLALAYTVVKIEDGFVHHYSVSVAGGYTSHTVGATFILFVSGLLGVPLDVQMFGVGRSTVHHAEFQLTNEGHTEFANHPIPEISLDDVKAFRAEWIVVNKQIQWERL